MGTTTKQKEALKRSLVYATTTGDENIHLDLLGKTAITLTKAEAESLSRLLVSRYSTPSSQSYFSKISVCLLSDSRRGRRKLILLESKAGKPAPEK